MSSVYLSLRASDGADASSAVGSGRALRFERGRPIAEFSLGRRGTWQTSAAGVADRHLWVRFDGQRVVLRRDAQSPPVSVDGLPLAHRAEPIVRLPCRIELGTAWLIVDDRAPPAPALEASSLVPAVAEPEESGGLSSPAFAPVAAAQRSASSSAVRTMAGGFASLHSGALVPAEHERMLGDGHATSVMPLDLLLRRGLLPKARAQQPESAPQRRRRPHEPRRGARAIAARAAALISRWSGALGLERRFSATLERRLAWGLLVPLVPLLCYALQPEPTRSSAGASFETTAWAASHEAGSAVAARRSPLAASASAAADSAAASPASPASPPASARSELASAALEPARDERSGTGSGAALPAIDARSGPTGERLAVDALAAGDLARARALYAALAQRSREHAAFAEAARILSREGRAAPSVPARDAAGAANSVQERSAHGVTTLPR